MAQSRRSDPRSPWRVGPGLREPHPAPARPRLGLTAREWRTVVLIVALLLASLVLDLRTPLGFAAATSFVFPVFITLWLRRPAVTLGVAALATGLAIGGYLFSPSLEVPQSAVIFNRVGSVVAVWITAMLVLWRLRLIETVRES